MALKYTPGSPQAKEHGCICPEVDNYYGKGINDGTIRNSETGQLVFYYDTECPYHGCEAYWHAHPTQ